MGTRLKDENSIEEILKEMSVREKAQMVSGKSPFQTMDMEQYGIPSIFMLDSCNGVNSMEYAAEAAYMELADAAAEKGEPLDPEANGYMGGLMIAFAQLQKRSAQKAEKQQKSAKNEIACYPPGICMASGWNPEVLRDCGAVLARDMGSRGIHMILGPNINIHRDPRCGRAGFSAGEIAEMHAEIEIALDKLN